MNHENHYTYIISSECGYFYIGMRTCKTDPFHDTKYWGSSKYLKTLRDQIPDSWTKDIVGIHSSRDEAGLAERKLLEMAVGHLACVNISKGQKSTWFGSSSQRSIQSKELWANAEYREKMRLAMLEVNNRPEVTAIKRVKSRAAALESWNDPVVKSRRIAGMTALLADPERKAARDAKSLATRRLNQALKREA